MSLAGINKKYVDAKKRAADFLRGRPQAMTKSSRLPPGQRVVPEMIAMPPVVSEYPDVPRERWELRAYGEVANECKWSWEAFNKLPKEQFVVDFHCVTSWTKLDQRFTGVPISELIKACSPLPSVKHVIFWCAEGYTTNVVFSELLEHQAFVAVEMDGKQLEPKFGGPARVVIPHLYGWKSAKHVVGIRFQSTDEPGFWEVRGYNNHANPWKEERYS